MWNLRWPTRYNLVGAKGQRPAWQITRGKRSQDHRQIWDLHRRQYRKTGIVAVPVHHPQMPVAGGLPSRQGSQALVPAH